MTLIRITGGHNTTNFALMKYACEHTPSLVIDCAGSANPHLLFPSVSADTFYDVHVMQCELLYVFRDILKRLPLLVRQIKPKTIVITSFSHLINYHDNEENDDILEQIWVTLSKLARTHDIFIAVHDERASRYCQTMGVEQWVIPSGAKEEQWIV